MLNVSKGEGELARARVGRGQGLRLTLDLNSNWVSHGTLPSDKQANTFSNIKYIVVGGGYLSKYLLFVLTTKSGCISGVGWTTGLSLSPSLKFACGPWQRDLGGGAQNQKWHESYKNETFDFCPGRFNVQLWNKLITRAGDSAGGYKPPVTRLVIPDLSRMPLASRECPCPPCSLFSLQVHNISCSIENHFFDDWRCLWLTVLIYFPAVDWSVDLLGLNQKFTVSPGLFPGDLASRSFLYHCCIGGP